MARLLSRVVAVAFVALFCAGAPVHAQSYSWDGIYIGGTIGGDIYRPSARLSPVPAGTCGNSPLPSCSPNGFLSAFSASGQLGYNWQYRSLILGPEVDGGLLNAHGNGNFVNIQSFNTDWLFLTRGRIGWAPEAPVLVYLAGGLAVTDLTVHGNYSSTSGATLGATIGGGVEAALTHSWTVKAEYLYVDFGSTTLPGRITTTFGLTSNIIRAGVNFHFNPP